MRSQDTATVAIGTISAHGEVIRRDAKAKTATVRVGKTGQVTGYEVSAQGIEGTVVSPL